MTDHTIDPVMDLSRATLMNACKGDVRKLPSFIVYDNEAWPWHNKVRPAKGRIHIQRSAFLRVVAPQVPVREGLWTGPQSQEFFIDLKAHHLDGSTETKTGENNHQTARDLAKADAAGRLPDEEDHGTPIVERSPVRNDERADLERIAASGEARGVNSTVFSGNSDGS